MIEKVFTSSTEEVDRLKKDGFVIVAMAHFEPDGVWKTGVYALHGPFACGGA